MSNMQLVDGSARLVACTGLLWLSAPLKALYLLLLEGLRFEVDKFKRSDT
jgi:hypothetical protein